MQATKEKKLNRKELELVIGETIYNYCHEDIDVAILDGFTSPILGHHDARYKLEECLQDVVYDNFFCKDLFHTFFFNDVVGKGDTLWDLTQDEAIEEVKYQIDFIVMDYLATARN